LGGMREISTVLTERRKDRQKERKKERQRKKEKERDIGRKKGRWITDLIEPDFVFSESPPILFKRSLVFPKLCTWSSFGFPSIDIYLKCIMNPCCDET